MTEKNAEALPCTLEIMGQKSLVGFEVVGISILMSNADGQAVHHINKLWARFYNESIVDRIPDKLGHEVYAVYSDYEGDHTKPYRLTIGCRVTGSLPVPPGLYRLRTESAKYQHLRATGEQPKALIKAWETVWTSDFPRRFGTDYEIYGPNFFKSGLHEVILCIGLGDDARLI